MFYLFPTRSHQLSSLSSCSYTLSIGHMISLSLSLKSNCRLNENRNNNSAQTKSCDNVVRTDRKLMYMHPHSMVLNSELLNYLQAVKISCAQIKYCCGMLLYCKKLNMRHDLQFYLSYFFVMWRKKLTLIEILTFLKDFFKTFVAKKILLSDPSKDKFSNSRY